ncbi:ATP-dependent endonuclease [Paeniglutamicibacter sp. NPDC012692]|uniref:ATP-dependent endonuclease n=1 Tax=Paeniglutamicibacter sp. NPDC012692 TaxID=3364388 RepID=UPI0036871E31
MGIVLVEGQSDAIAVQVLAERLGLPAPRVLAVGGSKGARRAARELAGQQLVGLVDAAERRDFESVLQTVFICDPDLESEFVRALGVEGVEEVMAQQGELESFRRLQAQPFLRGQPVEHQLARFFGGRSGNKARYARFLAQAVALERIPRPLNELLASLASQDAQDAPRDR